MQTEPIHNTQQLWPAADEQPVMPTATPLRFATTNPGKLAEIAGFLNVPAETLEGIQVELPELHPSSALYDRMRSGAYEECTRAIAAQKARDAFIIQGKDVTVEDSGLYLVGLKGLPGPCIKDWCTPEGLKALTSQGGQASFVVAFAYFSGRGEPQIRSAAIDGLIAPEPRGTEGFGFDSIFIPSPKRQAELWPDLAYRTYGEMSAEEKRKISPRSLALQQMADQPFEAPPVLPSVRIPVAALRSVRDDFQTPVPENHREVVERACNQHISDRLQRIRSDMKSLSARIQLVYEGELPERILDSHSPHAKALIRNFDNRDLYAFTVESATSILTNGVLRMELINHPMRLEAQLRVENNGFVPVRGKHVPALDYFATRNRATTFDDFKLGYEGGLDERRNLERIIGIMTQGLWTWSSTKLVTGFTVGSSVPAMNSAFAMAEGALCGNLMFAPVDSFWANPEAQTAMLAMAHHFIESHPFLEVGRFNGVKLSNGETVEEFVKQRAHRLIGATLKARENEIAERTEQLLSHGVTVFRPYEAGVTRTLQASLRAMTSAHRGVDMVTYAGQVGSVEQAKQCIEAGAHALIVGIGDGDLCTTADVAAIAADNPQLVYQLVKANLGVPIGADGGVGSRAPVAAALGAAFRIRAGALAGGTLSLRLVKVSAPDAAGQYFDPTAGEASAMTKLRGSQVDALGEPMNVEGTSAREFFEPNSPHIPRRIWDEMAGIAKALRFHGNDSLLELMHTPEPRVLSLTPNAIRKGSSHPAARESRDMPVYHQAEFVPLLSQRVDPEA